MKSILTRFTITLTLICGIGGPVYAQSSELAELGKETFPEWLSHDTVISAIKAQNEVNKSLSEVEVIAMDKQWRAETAASIQPMIQKIMDNSLSAYLALVKAESAGVYTEVFVMDNKGINVGQSDVTSDYWQGDEAKWQKTYLLGADAIHVSEIELDESSQQFQSQVSLSVVDPANGEVIGAVTVGINIDAM